MAEHNVFGYMMQPDVEECVWHMYYKMQQAIKDEGLVLLDNLTFKDFVNICYKYTSQRPEYLHTEEEDDDDADVEEEIEDPSVRRLASLAESEA